MNLKTLLTLVAFLSFYVLIGQMDDDQIDYLMVRVDNVKPVRAADYEASLTDLRLFLIDNKVKDVNYITQLQDNYHYTHVAMLNSMEDINGGLGAYIKGKKTSAEFNLVWSDINETLNNTKYFIVKYEPELSYVPDGKVWLDSKPYRRWNYLYFEPGTLQEAEDILRAWRNLYQAKNVTTGFRVFKGVLGLEQPVIMITTWSESPLDYQIELQESIDLLDTEGTVLWVAMMELMAKAETVEGWYLPQYSFHPGMTED